MYFILTTCLIASNSPMVLTGYQFCFERGQPNCYKGHLHSAIQSCQSAIQFPDSTVISQPSGAALPDLCLDLRLNSLSPSTSYNPESQLRPPLLIYEPFHTVLLPLET